MVDTALLIAGALTAAMYFTANTADEIELRKLADALYRRIDWRWAQNGGATISQGWKPESGFLNYGWDGYSEAIVLYVLALGSPTYPLEEQLLSRVDCDVPVGEPVRSRLSVCGAAVRASVFARLDRLSAASRIASCARSAATTSKTAGARPTSSASTRGATRAVRRLRRGLLGHHRLRRPERRDAGRTRRASGTCSATPRAACRTDRTTERSPAWAPLASLPFAPEIVLAAARSMLRALPGDAHRRTAMRAASTRRSRADGARVGLAGPLRARPGDRCPDDRELPHGARSGG